MISAHDFIILVQNDLQDKSEHWKREALFAKLQGSYAELQADLPFFVFNQTIDTTKDKEEYYLRHRPLQNVSCASDHVAFEFTEIENFYSLKKKNRYTFNEDVLLMRKAEKRDEIIEVTYKYAKALETLNCNVELPERFHTALRYLMMARLHEKPTLNSKQRNLSAYYLKLYETEILKLKRDKPTRVKNITSNFQRI